MFWVFAAGKNAMTSARGLALLLDGSQEPFEKIRNIGKEDLPSVLKSCGIGCYNGKAITLWELVNSNIDLRKCTTDDLEKVYGIGMKTSICFIMHSRKNSGVAGLDTHILKHLIEQGVKDVPKSTPGSVKVYKRLEKEMLRLASEAGMTVEDYDLMVWNKYSGKEN